MATLIYNRNKEQSTVTIYFMADQHKSFNTYHRHSAILPGLILLLVTHNITVLHFIQNIISWK